MRRRRRELSELERTRAGYDAALAESGAVLFQQVAPDTDAHHVSASAAAVLGWPAEEFLVPGALRGLVHPEDLRAFRAVVPVGPVLPPAPALPPTTAGPVAGVAFNAVPAPVAAAVATEPVVRLRTPDGDWRHVMVRRTPGPPDAPVRGVLVDVSVGTPERTRTGRFAEVVESSADATLVLEFCDPDDPATLVIRAANRRARAMFRLESRLDLRHEQGAVPLDAVFGNGSAQLLRSALFDVAHTGQRLTAERLVLSEVPDTYLDVRVDRLADGSLGVTIVDVSQLVAVEERLHHLVTHDGLTGLPNLRRFEERVTAALADLACPQVDLAVSPADRGALVPANGTNGTNGTGATNGSNGTAAAGHPVVRAVDARSTRAAVGIVLVDLDGLREINTAHGHAAGDRLLVGLARRLGDAEVAADVVARTGGSQFAVLTAPAATVDEVLARVEAVRRAVDQPVDVDGHLLAVGACCGHAVAPVDGDDARSLLRVAEESLRRAQADRLPALDGSGPGVALLTELRRGLANRELELRFQPVVELRTGRVTRVEALLRWQREDDGARLPVEFLELAERSGLIQPLTRWVLGEAARAAALLDRPGHRTVVSTNLSLRNLRDGELLSFVELLVQSGELDPALVELELPETELTDDPVTAREVLSRLAATGLRVVVDEFGSGYTSVSTLAELDIAGLKVDRSFISTLAAVPADVAAVRTTVSLAHELGLSVGAEGVADGASLAVLAELGCDHAQGVHLSGPVTLDDLADRVADLEAALAGWVAAADTVGSR